MQLRTGANFAGYVIERCIGTGGMGSVYLARHPRLERSVALKVLTDTFTTDTKVRAAFDREVTLAARLDHPNIVAVYDRSGPDDAGLWLTMRYIAGGDAGALLAAAPGGLPPEEAVRLVADAAEALDFAHEQGVIHRDVKPANLLIEVHPRSGQRALLTDFGIARSLDDTVTTSSVAASFAYAAPERFTHTADHRADIYSLGCTLYHLLTGSVPFPRGDQAAVIAAHLTGRPPAPRDLRPDLPRGLDTVIATAMAKRPGRRYPTCAALAEAAREALTTPSAPAPPVPPMRIPAAPAKATHTLPLPDPPPTIPEPSRPDSVTEANPVPESAPSEAVSRPVPLVDPAGDDGVRPVGRDTASLESEAVSVERNGVDAASGNSGANGPVAPVGRNGIDPVSENSGAYEPAVPIGMNSASVDSAGREPVFFGAGAGADGGADADADADGDGGAEPGVGPDAAGAGGDRGHSADAVADSGVGAGAVGANGSAVGDADSGDAGARSVSREGEGVGMSADAGFRAGVEVEASAGAEASAAAGAGAIDHGDPDVASADHVEFVDSEPVGPEAVSAGSSDAACTDAEPDDPESAAQVDGSEPPEAGSGEFDVDSVEGSRPGVAESSGSEPSSPDSDEFDVLASETVDFGRLVPVADQPRRPESAAPEVNPPADSERNGYAPATFGPQNGRYGADPHHPGIDHEPTPLRPLARPKPDARRPRGKRLLIGVAVALVVLAAGAAARSSLTGSPADGPARPSTVPIEVTTQAAAAPVDAHEPAPAPIPREPVDRPRLTTVATVVTTQLPAPPAPAPAPIPVPIPTNPATAPVPTQPQPDPNPPETITDPGPVVTEPHPEPTTTSSAPPTSTVTPTPTPTSVTATTSATATVSTTSAAAEAR